MMIPKRVDDSFPLSNKYELLGQSEKFGLEDISPPHSSSGNELSLMEVQQKANSPIPEAIAKKSFC